MSMRMDYGPVLELAKLKHDTEKLLMRSLKCFGHDESCEVEKCDLDRDDDACTCEYKPLVADIEAFLKTVSPKL